MKIESEVIKTVDFAPIEMGDGGPLVFRLEVHRQHDSGKFVSKLLRLERMRVQPTFPQREGKPTSDVADELMWVIDEGPIEPVTGSTPDEIVTTVCEKLRAFFGDRRSEVNQ